MTKSEINSLDLSHMHDLLTRFPAQVEEGIALGRAVEELPFSPACRNVVVLGMGGSAIGGDLLRTYHESLHHPMPLRFSVVRNYSIPDYVSHDDFIIASSYSGNTEETLSAFAQGIKKTKRILCISAGGELTMQARAYSLPLVRLPGGLQPRCAVGYSFFPVLLALNKPNIVGEEAVESTEEGVRETLSLLKKKSAIWSKFDAKKNPALALAEKIAGSIAVIYSPAEIFEAVGLRWRNQFQENAKQMAYSNVLPEMNHNEIEGWSYPKKFGKKCSVVLLRDEQEHDRVSLRFDILKELIGTKTGSINEVWSEGETTLARMFSLLYFGDWVSFYLAILNGVDPTEIPTLIALKKRLAAGPKQA